MIFPEAMKTLDDYRRFKAAVKVPILANLTEFGYIVDDEEATSRSSSDERLLDRATSGNELLVLAEEVRWRDGRSERGRRTRGRLVEGRALRRHVRACRRRADGGGDDFFAPHERA